MDEIQRLIMQVEGQAKIEALTKDLDVQKRAMADLVAQYKAGQISIGQYSSSMMTAATRAVPLANGIKEAEKSIGSLGPAMLQASYIVQDFTSSLSGGQGLARAISNVQNNIPGFLQSLGKGAGMAGVVGIASVAVVGLYDVTKSLYALWEGGAAEKEIERQKKLKKAFDDAREALQKQIDLARSQQTDAQKAAGAAVTAATGGPDFDKVTSNVLGMDDDEFARKRNELEAQAATARQQGVTANRGGGRQRAAAVAAAKKREDAARAQVADLDRQKTNAQGLVVNARGGDMDAYDQLLKRTSGDVRDNLAANDPRKAGMRGAAQAGAKAQISDALGDFLQPLISGLKDRLKAEKDAIAQGKAIDEFGNEGEGEAGRALKGAARDRAKAIGDTRRAARNVVEDKPLPMQDFMPVNPGFQEQFGQNQLRQLEQQAGAIQEQMQMQGAAGFDLGPLQQALEQIQRQYGAVMQQQQQMRQQLSKQMGGQMGGGAFTAQPMFQGGDGQ